MNKIKQLSLSFFLSLLSLSAYSQKTNLQLLGGVNYASPNYVMQNYDLLSIIEGSGEFTQYSLYHLGFDFSPFQFGKFSMGVGVEYAFTRFEGKGQIIAPSNQSTIESQGVRNYSFQRVNLSRYIRITPKNHLIVSVHAKLGLPFLSYDINDESATNGRLFNFPRDANDEPMRQDRYVDEEFFDGWLYGFELSCLYTIHAEKNKSGIQWLIGPSCNFLRLHSSDELKISAGLKLGVMFNTKSKSQE